MMALLPLKIYDLFGIFPTYFDLLLQPHRLNSQMRERDFYLTPSIGLTFFEFLEADKNPDTRVCTELSVKIL